MKTLTKYLLAAAAIMTVASCRKDETSSYLTTDSVYYEAYAAEGEITLTFKTNVKNYDVATESEWISILSKASSSVVINVQKNGDQTERTAEIRFIDGNEVLTKAYVRQAAAAPAITLGANAITVTSGTTVLEIQFEVNFEYELTSSVPWIRFAPPAKAVDTGSFFLYLKRNNTLQQRTGILTIIDKSTGNEMAKVEITQEGAQVNGFYFLNEGQWGKNNASMGYFGLSAGTLDTQWWANLNPTVRGGLGDVANDVVTADDYLLVAVNASNLLEICDRDGKHLREVEIPECRMIAWDGDFAYVTSYADNGFVAKVDPAAGNILAKCAVGHEPEGLAIVGQNLYVLNSCSYHTDFSGGGNNEVSTISVIDLESFTETEKVNIGIINAYSPLTLMPDGKSFYINSSGDYNSVAAKSVIFDSASKTVTKDFGFGGTYACTYQGKLYIFETSFSYSTFEWGNNNCVYDPASDTLSDFPVDEEEFYTFGAPSGLWINPLNGDIFIADKGNYTSPGYLYRFSSDGTQTGKFPAGVCPGHLAWDLR